MSGPDEKAPPPPPGGTPQDPPVWPSDDDDSDRTILAPAPPPVDVSHPGATVVAPMQSAPQYDPAPAQADPISLRSLQPGTVINNMYRVEESLGQGGMGRVFRGVEIGTGEPVAIKVILPEMADDKKVAQMFRREARTLRQLHHDAIVRYFAYVPPDERLNLHALVMGFIEGIKLSDRLRQKGPLERDDICRLFIRLAGGLQRAHEGGVVHRDLSPDNVMLPDGDLDKAVLIDFGISRSSRIRDVTIGNEFAGKLKYVSPEQLGAFGGEADHRSDIYSLGLLMMAAMAGGPPKMGGNFADAVTKRQSVPDLEDVLSEFQPLIYRMLQPDPADRLKSMNDVIAALQNIANASLAPGELPGSFRGTGPLEGARATDFPYPTGMTGSPSGLQVSPGRSEGNTETAMRTRTAMGGMTATPGTIVAVGSGASDKPARSSRAGLLLLLSVVVVGIAAIGSVLYWSEGGPGARPAAPEQVDLLARTDGTPQAFLAENVPAECAFATLRGRGQIAGKIEAFAPADVSLASVTNRWPEAFGAAPGVEDRRIAAGQCAALDLARLFQGTKGPEINIALETFQLSRADSIAGGVRGGGDRAAWLAIVAPGGRVFSLARRLEEPEGSQRRFAFKMPSAPPGIYLLVAIASQKALVRAGAMKDGTAAEDIMPLIGRELAKDGQGSVDLAYLVVTK